MAELNILFVCIGNTCRSPMAESIMNHKISKKKLNWKTDSAALRAWNVGIKPEERCIKVLQEHGLNSNHLGRIITPEDFYKFDYILGMDEKNLSELESLAANLSENGDRKLAKIGLLGSYLQHEDDKIIPDPYFSNGISAFRHVYEQIDESCDYFMKEMLK